MTIGMPTYNRVWALPRVLEAIESLDHPKEKMSLVFVDNHSTDGTQEILHEFRKEHLNEYGSIRVVVEETNIPQARSVCIQEAVGSDYILFIDSDIVPPPNTIKHLLEIFAENPKAGFVGFPPQHLPALLGEKAWFSKMPNKPHITETLGHDCTMVKMEVYHQIGLYNPAFGADEDTEFIWRARKAGYIVILDPTIKVLHLRKQMEEFFLKSIVNYGKFMFTKMAYYRFKLLIESHHFKTFQKWVFYTLFTLSIPFLLLGIVFNQIFFSMSFVVLFAFLFVFHAVRARGIMRVVNPFFYAFMGIAWAAGMWKQLIKHIVRKLRRKAGCPFLLPVVSTQGRVCK